MTMLVKIEPNKLSYSKIVKFLGILDHFLKKMDLNHSVANCFSKTFSKKNSGRDSNFQKNDCSTTWFLFSDEQLSILDGNIIFGSLCTWIDSMSHGELIDIFFFAFN